MRLFSPAFWTTIILGFVAGSADSGTTMGARDLTSGTPALRPATCWKTPF